MKSRVTSFLLIVILVVSIPIEFSDTQAVKDSKTVVRKVLEGVKPARSDSTFIGAFQLMLKAAGADWSIPRLSGLLGKYIRENYLQQKLK